jgi:hypothetical protein
MSWYTQDLRRILKAVPCKYPGLIWDVIEYEDHLSMCLYRDNFSSLDVKVQEYIANEFVPSVLNAAWSNDTPMFLEVRDVAGYVTG